MLAQGQGQGPAPTDCLQRDSAGRKPALLCGMFPLTVIGTAKRSLTVAPFERGSGDFFDEGVEGFFGAGGAPGVVVLPLDLGVFLEVVFDLPAGEDDGGVVLVAHGLADLGEAHLGEAARQIHAEGTGQADGAVFFRRMDVRDRDAEVLGDGRDDIGIVHHGILPRDMFSQHLLGDTERDGPAAERRKRRQLDQGAFQFAHVGADASSDKLDHLL